MTPPSSSSRRLPSAAYNRCALPSSSSSNLRTQVEGIFTIWRSERRDWKTRSNWRGHSRLMKWEMEMEEIKAMLERIWDFHDKISDAIHAISRADFLKSTKNLDRASPEKKQSLDGDLGSGKKEEGSCRYVFVKGFRVDEGAILAKAKSLNAISTVLKNLEDQLEFFHLMLMGMEPLWLVVCLA